MARTLGPGLGKADEVMGPRIHWVGIWTLFSGLWATSSLLKRAVMMMWCCKAVGCRRI